MSSRSRPGLDARNFMVRIVRADPTLMATPGRRNCVGTVRANEVGALWMPVSDPFRAQNTRRIVDPIGAGEVIVVQSPIDECRDERIGVSVAGERWWRDRQSRSNGRVGGRDVVADLDERAEQPAGVDFTEEVADLIGGFGHGRGSGREPGEVLANRGEEPVDEFDGGRATAGLDHRDRRLGGCGRVPRAGPATAAWGQDRRDLAPTTSGPLSPNNGSRSPDGGKECFHVRSRRGSFHFTQEASP